MNGELSGNSTWEFIDSGTGTGTYNMDLDTRLVEMCRQSGRSFLRFYRWKPYAISLGYNQKNSSAGFMVDRSKCIQDGIDVVQRPTGGRAVLHSEELTYSVVLRSDSPTSGLYRDISLSILKGLRHIDRSSPELQNISFTKEDPDILKLIRTGMYNLCFNTSVRFEINHKGRKIVGSAQRRFGDVVLQHGSVMLGNHHRNIINYIRINGIKERSELKKEIEEKTTSLGELLNREVTYAETAGALLKGFSEFFGALTHAQMKGVT